MSVVLQNGVARDDLHCNEPDRKSYPRISILRDEIINKPLDEIRNRITLLFSSIPRCNLTMWR
jgi:hypothetical protein